MLLRLRILSSSLKTRHGPQNRPASPGLQLQPTKVSPWRHDLAWKISLESCLLASPYPIQFLKT